MIHKQSYKAYAAATQTVAKTKQVVMLYDAAIKSVYQAREAIDRGDIQSRYNALVKACEIVFGLQGCLDFEQGQEIAQTLYDFYASVDARLLTVHRTNNAATCDQVIKELRMMREAWEEIDKLDEQGAGTIPPVGAMPRLQETHAQPEGGVAISA